MNLQLFFSTLFLFFFAELGDKTQLAALSLSAKEKSPFTIFFAAVLGFALSTLIAVFFGAIISKFIPPPVIQKGAALLFISIGLLLFFNKL